MNYDRYVFDLEKGKLASLPTLPLNNKKKQKKTTNNDNNKNSNNNHLYCTSQI